MSIAGCFVSCAKDRVVSPGPYVTGDQFHDRRLKAVSPALTHTETHTGRNTLFSPLESAAEHSVEKKNNPQQHKRKC